MRVLSPAAVALLAFLATSISEAQDTDPDEHVWSTKLDAKVKRFGITPRGLFFAETDKYLGAWRIESGEEAWRIPGLAQPLQLDSGHIVATAGPGLALVDGETGTRLWTIDSLPLRALKAYMATEAGVLVAFGAVDKRTVRVLGIALKTGKILWSTDSLALTHRSPSDQIEFSGYQVPLPDSTIILRFTGGKAVRVALTTGATLWQLSANPEFWLGAPPASAFQANRPYLGHAPPIPIGDYLLASSGAIQVGSGSVVWRTPEKPTAWIPAFTPTARGVVITMGMGGDRSMLRLVDPATGNEHWRTPSLKSAGAFAIRRDTIFLALDRGLAVIDFANGSVLKTMPLPDFTHLQEAERLDTLAGGDLLLESDHNLMRVTSDGSVVFHRHYDIPKRGTRPLQHLVAPRYRNPQNLSFVYTSDLDDLGQKGIVLIDREQGRELGTLRRKDRSAAYAVDVMSRMAVAIEGEQLNGFRIAAMPH